MNYFPPGFACIKTAADEHPKYEELTKIIDNYAAEIRGAASGNWLLSRTFINIDGEDHYTIGGSEMATVIGCNPYQKPEQLREVKAHLITTGQPTVEVSSDALRAKWGHIVEPIQRRHCNALLGTVVHDIPVSIPHSGHPNIRYTPDGIGVVRLKTSKCYAREGTDNDEAVIALFEFKNPFDRVVGDAMPQYYIPQVLTGLEVIPITPLAIYNEANWKIKPLGHLLQPPYNSRVHMRGSINGKTGGERYDGIEVIDATVIVIYCTEEDPLQRVVSEHDSENDYETWLLGAIRAPSSLNHRINFGRTVIDFGNTTTDVLTALVNLIEFYPDRVKYDFIDLYSEMVNYSPNELIALKNREIMHRGHYPFGLLPIALYKEAFHILHRHQFLKKHERSIKAFIDDLNVRIEELGGPKWKK